MINIIKEGVQPNYVKRFRCPKCGCEFDTDEYRHRFDRNEDYYVCTCPMPWCGAFAYPIDCNEAKGEIIND